MVKLNNIPWYRDSLVNQLSLILKAPNLINDEYIKAQPSAPNYANINPVYEISPPLLYEKLYAISWDNAE